MSRSPAPVQLPSTCWECSTTCGSVLTVHDGRVTKVGPNRKHPASNGAFCAKGIKALPEWTYRDDRLLRPMRRVGRRGAGHFEPIDWDAALDLIAEQFARTIEEYGPLAIAGAVSGGFFSRGAIVALLLRALGSPNWLINQDLCGGCRGVSDMVTGLTITNGEDIEHTRTALVVGRNAYTADPVQWRALTALKKRGGQIVCLDPNETPLTKLADLWLRPRPNTDAALAMAMMQVVISERLYDLEFVSKWCIGFDELTRRVAACPPEVAAQLTGVPADAIVQAARMYADGPSVFVSGHGIDAFTAGFQTFRAFHCLLAICGFVDKPGGNLRATRPPGLRNFLDLVHAPEFQLPPGVAGKTLGAEQFPLWAGPTGWQTACHNPTVLDAILTSQPYPVRAMYVSGVNIAVTYPDPARTVEAMKALDFCVVAAHEINPTAAWADLVLPKTTTLEEEDIHVQPRAHCVSLTQPAHAPRGEARDDFAIARGLLDRLSKRVPVDDKLFPWRTKRDFNTTLLGDSGISLDLLREQGFVTYDNAPGDFASRPFKSPSGKVELYSARLDALGLDPLPSFVAPRVSRLSDEDRRAFPLVLLTGERDKNYHHSRFRDQAWLRRQIPHPVFRLHPETAQRLGFENGDWIGVRTPLTSGEARGEVVITERVQADVISTGMGWWLPEADGPDFANSLVNINAVLTYSGPFDPATGSVDSRGLPCRAERSAAPAQLRSVF
ncbi:MAG: molybdopterin-dependent oxidoreductase [Pseudomonadota bacterium]